MKNELTHWKDILFSSANAFGEELMSAIPGILGAIIWLILGWFVARFLSRIATKVLRKINFDKLGDRLKIDQFYEKAELKPIEPSKVVGKFIYWILMLFVVVVVSEILGLSVVSEEITRLMSYLPTLFIAVVIFIVGTYFATVIRDIVKAASTSLGLSTSKIITGFIFYFLMIVVSLTALKQAGVDTSLITNNLVMIVGIVFVAGAIAYGFAARNVMENILSSYFSKNQFEEGQIIEMDGKKGTIVSLDRMHVTLDCGDAIEVIPVQRLLKGNVTIFKSK